MVNVFHDGTFTEQLFRPDRQELWTRTISVVILFALLSFGQYMLVAQRKTIAKLEETLVEVNTLSGLIPICAWCKSIRGDEGYWQSVEEYLGKHSKAEFTHSMCARCYDDFMSKEGNQNYPSSKTS